MNFRLARDQVVILETAANSWAFVGKQNLLFPLGPVIVSGFSLPGASSSYLASKKSVLLRLLLSPRVTSAAVTELSDNISLIMIFDSDWFSTCAIFHKVSNKLLVRFYDRQ